MNVENLISSKENIKQDKSYRAGLISKKQIALTEEKLIELKGSIFTNKYKVIDRDKILSTKLDYRIKWSPFLVGIALFSIGLNIDRVGFIESKFPLLSAGLMLFAGMTFLYGIAKIRKEHLIETENPDVSLSLPRKGKSTEILNKITKEL